DGKMQKKEFMKPKHHHKRNNDNNDICQIRKENADQADAENEKFSSLTPDSPCKIGQNACVNGEFAQCPNGKFVLFPCAATEQCFSLPLVLSRGTSLTCDTPADKDARLEQARNCS
ncbi:26486_t:CDS:2, partial [Dentiscutata erythropus]